MKQTFTQKKLEELQMKAMDLKNYMRMVWLSKFLLT